MADNKGPRRRFVIVIGAILAIVIYGLAVEQTGVSLDQITSETRQTRLVRIIRSLAQPELVTYDFEEVNTDFDFFIPCTDDTGPVTEGGVTISAACGEPGDVITISATGFEPFSQGRLQFIPDSDFDVSLPLGIFEADGSGTFEQDVELPNRRSDDAQTLRVQVPRQIGSWGDRQEVWTDTNENGIRDLGVIRPSGLEVTFDGQSPDLLAAALLDPTNQVTELVSIGDTFVAVDGPANGLSAEPVDASSGDVSITGLTTEGDQVVITVDGPEGTDLSGWRIALYDGTSGEVVGNTEFLGDQIELSPRVSEQASLTLDKIIDTVFLALIATTAGLVVALPLSFIAARNLMKDVSTTVLGLALGLISIPMGVVAGLGYLRLQRSLLGEAPAPNLMLVVLLIIGGAISYILGKQIFFGAEEVPSWVRTARAIAAAVGVALALEGLFGLLTSAGEALKPVFGPLDFIPALFSTLGEIGTVILPFVIAGAGAAIALGLAGRIGRALVDRLPLAGRRVLEWVMMAAAGALVAALIGAVIDWLYQIADPVKVLWVPAAVGAILGLVVAWLGQRQGEVKIGLSIYYVARTIFNTLRSIEPLVMVIVFVVWVGFGEFAGSIALALHTSAALAKLYSEQVESIAEGPLEAVRATGANRLQSIIYAVVPQIVPPYISFTMYRWDINVRMSTILGFAGGGGIGFLLNQNVQLGQYRAAAVQMLAIAIVVASMDYASSRLRERFT